MVTVEAETIYSLKDLSYKELSVITFGLDLLLEQEDWNSVDKAIVESLKEKINPVMKPR